MKPDKTDLLKPDKTDIMKPPKNELMNPPKDEIWKPPSDDFVGKPGFEIPFVPGWGGDGAGEGGGGSRAGGSSGGSLKQSTRYSSSIVADIFGISVTPKQAKAMGLYSRDFSGFEIRPLIENRAPKHKTEKAGKDNFLTSGNNIFKASKGKGGKINIFRLK
jgi:hypothetical protein